MRLGEFTYLPPLAGGLHVVVLHILVEPVGPVVIYVHPDADVLREVEEDRAISHAIQDGRGQDGGVLAVTAPVHQRLKGVTSVLVESRGDVVRGVRQALDERDDKLNDLDIVVSLRRGDVVELAYDGGYVLVVEGVGDVDGVVGGGHPGPAAVVVVEVLGDVEGDGPGLASVGPGEVLPDGALRGGLGGEGGRARDYHVLHEEGVVALLGLVEGLPQGLMLIR